MYRQQLSLEKISKIRNISVSEPITHIQKETQEKWHSQAAKLTVNQLDKYKLELNNSQYSIS